MNTVTHIYLGADHRGFELKEKVKPWLEAQGYQVTDCGNTVMDEDDDYPIFALKVAEAVAQNPDTRGILLCGSGVGVSVAANKVKGIRASVGISPMMIQKGREDDDLNVLVIAADFQDESEAQALMMAFLQASSNQGERYQRRISQITEYENAH